MKQNKKLSMDSKDINLSELRAGFEGKPLRELIRHHLTCQSQARRIKGINGTVAILPEEARGVVEGFIDQWNLRVYDRDFWESDTALIFDQITQDAYNVFSEMGLSTNDEMLFNMFNIIVLSYAYSAYDQPKMREFMGISVPVFPWVSASSLLYPVGATVYIATQTPASPSMIMGYGLVNLGYLLFGAGIVKGTFRIFGLKKRWQVFVVAVIVFLIGTVLSNISA